MAHRVLTDDPALPEVLDVIGQLLPAAAGIALSPFPIVAAILVAASPRARSAGPAFTLGWVVGLCAVTAVAVGVGAAVGSGEPATWAAWVRVLLGAALVVLGGRKLAGRLRSEEPATVPGWADALVTASPGRALVVGIGLAGLNPKNLAFALASASVIGQVDQSAGRVLAEAAVFVLLASWTVLGVSADPRDGSLCRRCSAPPQLSRVGSSHDASPS